MTNTTMFKKNLKLQPDTEGADREREEAKMTTALRKVSDRWGEQRKRTASDELRFYYSQCVDIRKIEDDNSNGGHKYGDGAVDMLCDVHDIDRGERKYFADVARFITPQFMEQIIESNMLPNAKYGPITKTHIQELARLKDEKQQHLLLQRVYQEKLSSVSLRTLITDLLHSGDVQPSKRVDNKKPTDTFKALIKGVDKLQEIGTSLLDDSLLERVTTAKIKNCPETLKTLDTAEEKVDWLIGILGDYRESLSVMKTRLTQRKVLAEEQGLKTDVLHAVSSKAFPSDGAGKKKTTKKKATKKKRAPAAAEGGATSPPKGAAVKKKKKAGKRPAATGPAEERPRALKKKKRSRAPEGAKPAAVKRGPKRPAKGTKDAGKSD